MTMPLFSLLDVIACSLTLLGLATLTPAFVQWLRPRPKREWRVLITDPDGLPGHSYLLDTEEVAKLVSILRRGRGQSLD